VTLATVLGQPIAVDFLRRCLQRGRLHHALLFFGPEGVGKEFCAFALATAFACKKGGLEGCGHCDACRRVLTMADNPRVPLHPDVILVGRGVYPPALIGRSTEEKSDISVDQIRRVVLERVQLSPHEARERVIIVRDAHDMGASAANALLKTLEEPPPNTRFVLVTSRPGELLPTIVSRTQAVRFASLPVDVVRALLAKEGVEASASERAARLSGGSMPLARSLADPQSTREQRQIADDLLRALSGTTIDLTDVAGSMGGGAEGRERWISALRMFSLEQSEAIRTAVSAHDLRAVDRALGVHHACQSLLAALERNANPVLAFETTWLRLREGHFAQ
jgi:DNA polymerase-3 subunit delta'